MTDLRSRERPSGRSRRGDAGVDIVHPRSRTRRRSSAAVLAAMALMATVGCDDSLTPAAADTPAATTSTTTPAPPPAVLWPLTGRESGTVQPHAALAVKIENSVDARPQTGLNSADMVWEEVVEGGITRFVAVYHSTVPAEIGPVRSVRPMDPAIAAPLHGVFAFSGGQAGYVSAVADAGMQVLSFDQGDDGFYRIDSRRAPHNVYANPQTLLGQADAEHQADPGAQFDFAATAAEATAPTTGTPATNLALTLSGVSHPQWTWSAAAAAWTRAEGTTPAVESDDTPLQATNVVVVRVDVVNTNATDPAGNPVPESVLEGQGTALVATGGTTLQVTWVKNSDADRLVLLDASGNPVRLAPGTTWIELVPNNGGAVTVS